MSKNTELDMQIVYLPLATVASAYAKVTERGSELITADMVDNCGHLVDFI